MPVVGGDPSDPAGRWLVEVGDAAPGSAPPFRWSTEDLTVLDASGAVHHYAGGLRSLTGVSSDDGTQGADAQGDVQSDVSVTVADPIVRWWEIDPALPCVVRRWLPGELLESAEVVARGRLADLEYDAPGSPATWSIGPDAAPVALMLDENARVDDVSWPIDDGTWEATEYHTAGAYYPLVFGRPGRVPAVCPRRTDDAGHYYEPWYVISADPATFRPICADAPAATGTVWVFLDGDAGPIYKDVVVPDGTAITIDGRGRPCVTLYAVSDDGVSAPQVLAAAADEEVAIQVMPGNPPTTPPPVVEGIRALPDVLDYVLGRWAAGAVDWGRLRDSYGAMAPYLVDTWVVERTPVWGWVTHLLEFTPFRLRRGPGGLYLAEHRVVAHPSRTVRAIDADSDGDVARVGRVRRTAGDGPFATLRIRYADRPDFDPVGLLHYGPTETAGSPPSGGATIFIAHPVLTAARDRGVTSDREIDLLWTWDDGTAALVADYQIARDALPHRRVAYRVPERWRLREGDQVELTDTAVGIRAATLAIVDVPVEFTDLGSVATFRIPE